ncbi:concanavalin A-like lectin/glucanase [Meredithblackwellia eburnea MCA 4105]
MKRTNQRLLTGIAVLVVLASSALAQAPAGGSTASNTSTSTSCGWENPCKDGTKPCCSDTLYCGTGPACMTGCNPNFSLQGYCTPVPLCQSSNYTFADTSRIQLNTSAWMGNASQYDFTLDHQDNTATSIVQDNQLVLILTEAGGGTKVSTTRSVLYGNITASIKTVGVVGVVTAFITMSGTKDEIDWEWTGNNTNQAQNNYFWEGDVADYTHGGTATAKNRNTQFITYGLVWTPDVLQWTVNGAVVRTLTRASTLQDNLYKFPQTPSRIQFSVWPAGISTQSQGTIDWAGGMIDWSDPSYTSQGYFAAYVQWLSVTCYDPSSLTFQASNTTTSSSRLRQRSNLGEQLEGRTLWERADQNLNSFVYGANDTNGQMQVFSSDAGTVINSVSSTGKNMIIPKSKSGSGSSGSGSSSGGGSSDNQPTTAAGKWWSEQGTAVKVGICVGGAAAGLFVIVGCCTFFARKKDRKQYAAIEAAKRKGGRDNIPLVEKKQQSGGGNPTGKYTKPEEPFSLNRPYANNSQASFGSGSKVNLAYGGDNGYGAGSGSQLHLPQYGGYSQQAYNGGQQQYGYHNGGYR